MNTTPAAKAIIDYESAFRNTANELCGAAVENQYKNYLLSPGRFVDSEAEEDDGIPYDEKMKLLTNMAAQFVESTVLEKRIWENI